MSLKSEQTQWSTDECEPASHLDEPSASGDGSADLDSRLAAAIEDSESRVVLFRVEDFVATLIARATGQDRLRICPAVGTLTAFLAVIAAAASVSLAAGQRLAFANVDLPFYVAVTELMLVWSRDSWRKFVRLANDFEVLIVGPGDRAAGARFLQSRLQVIPQAAAGGLGSVLGLFCGMLSMEAEHRGVVADLPYLASMLVTGAVGASVVYWLWAGVTFLGQVSQLKSLTLAGEHEGHSLIRNIYGIVGLARIRVGVGLFLAELPLLVLAHSAPHSHVLLAATAAVFLLCFATLAATGIGPDIFLGRVARTSQDSEIKELIGRRARLEPLEPVEAFQADCHLRQTIVAIRSRPVRRLSASTVANVTAATVTALLPFVALVLKYGLHL